MTNETIALLGAAGKMGTRAMENLRKQPAFTVLPVEEGEAGLARLRARGESTLSADDALARATAVVLAVPDARIGAVARNVAPRMREGSLILALDAAAAYAGEFDPRPGLGYVLAHPCHPTVTDPVNGAVVKDDWFGGVRAEQPIVIALLQGSAGDLDRGEAIARAMYSPVNRAHRITVEQMAILEPAMAETVAGACMSVIRDAMDEAIRRGVPEAAARDFLLGHVSINLGMYFGFEPSPLSDGAKITIARGRKAIIRDDWARMLDRDRILGEIAAITKAQAG